MISLHGADREPSRAGRIGVPDRSPGLSLIARAIVEVLVPDVADRECRVGPVQVVGRQDPAGFHLCSIVAGRLWSWLYIVPIRDLSTIAASATLATPPGPLADLAQLAVAVAQFGCSNRPATSPSEIRLA
jgi:hypothetical protein